MTISVRLNEQDTTLFKKYAEMHGMSVSDMVRRAVLERIEDEYDLDCYYRAMEDFKQDPVTYTMDEIKKELGL